MAHSRDNLPDFFFDGKYLFHERGWFPILKQFGGIFLQYRGGKWPETFPPLDFQVEKVFGVGPAGISQYRAVAQGPGAKFAPASEPAYHPSIADARGNSLIKLLVIRYV